MKLGIVTAYYRPKVNACSVRINSFVDCWKEKRDCKLYVFTAGHEDLDNNEDKNIKIWRSNTSIVNNKKGIISRLLSELYFSFLVFTKLLFVRVDKYLVTSPPFILTIGVMMISKIKQIPYIVDVRDLYPEVLFESNIISKKSLIGKLFLYLEKKIYNNADKVITVTVGLKEYIERKTDKPVHLVRNGFDQNLFFPEKFLEKSPFIIIFHGTIGKLQNIELLIEYANYLKNNLIKDIEIWVVGDGPKRKMMLEEIEKKKLQNIIKFYGFKTLEEVPKYINMASIGFSPRNDGFLNETAFPVKVYEYMGCGIPVIVTPISEAGDFIEKNKIGFQIENNDLELLHKRIIHLKNNKSLYNEYSKRSVEVSKNFSRKKHALQLYDIIVGLINCN